MPKENSLSNVEKGKILAFIEENVGKREIARRIGRSDKVVRNFLQNTDEYGTRKGRGRKQLLSQREQARI